MTITREGGRWKMQLHKLVPLAIENVQIFGHVVKIIWY